MKLNHAPILLTGLITASCAPLTKEKQGPVSANPVQEQVEELIHINLPEASHPEVQAQIKKFKIKFFQDLKNLRPIDLEERLGLQTTIHIFINPNIDIICNYWFDNKNNTFGFFIESMRINGQNPGLDAEDYRKMHAWEDAIKNELTTLLPLIASIQNKEQTFEEALASLSQ